MDFQSVVCVVVGVVLVWSASLGSAGDIVHQDEDTPRRPGCDNNFVLVRNEEKP
jgi:signal peptide peptidase-like protein 2B